MNNVKLELQGETGVLTICHEKALNALNTRILREIEEAVETVKANGELRCLIVTGEGGKAFAAGADISEMLAVDALDGQSFSNLGSRILLEIERLPIPTIAAVNGYALGGGCELALSCDIRIASQNALFGQPEVALGLIPGWGGTQRLARVIGMGRACEMIFTGKPITASEALACGLVNHVYPQEVLLEEAFKLAKKIAASAPIAVRCAKQAIHDGLLAGLESGLETETGMFGVCFASSDAKKGINAFLNKEKGIRFDNK
jgi:enoyl-CoA hydratase